MADDKCICQQISEQKKEFSFFVEREIRTGKELFEVKVRPFKNDLVIVSLIEKTLVKQAIPAKPMDRFENTDNFGIWEFDIDKKIVECSQETQRICGINQRLVSSELAMKIFLPQFRVELQKSMKNLIGNEKPFNFHFTIKRQDTNEIRQVYAVAEFQRDKRKVAGFVHDVTESKLARQYLLDSLSDLQLAQRIAHIGNWSYNPATNLTTWSEYMFSIFERDPQKGPLNFFEFRNLLERSDFYLFFQTFQKAYRVGVPFEFELKVNFSQEKIKWIKCICQPEKKAGSKKFLLRGTVQDITSTKQSEEDIHHSNQLLRSVFDMIPDAMYVKDINLRKIMANRGDAYNCGANDVSEIIGKTDFEIYSPEIAGLYTQDDKKVLETGEAIINREEILPAPSRIRTILTSKFPVRNNENQIVGLIGIGRDITELRENESQMRLFQQAIEQSPLAVVITNRNGTIEYVNPLFTMMTGFASDEVIGQNPRFLKSGEHDTAFYQKLWDTICSGENWYGEFHNKRKDGSLYWESAVIAPIFNAKNEITCFVAMKEDISDKKQMIQDLRKAKEKAEESDRLKTLFLANLSHEIRTPLNGILGFSNIICSEVIDKEKLNFYGKIIEKSGKRLISAINDIIDISMIQSKQLKIEYDYFSINDLLREIYFQFRYQKSDRLSEIEFNVRFCDNEEYDEIYSDKNRILQVLKNLLDNSFKFTESGQIELGCCEAEENQIVLYVRDTGTGIEESKLNIIFQPFRQAEEGNSRKFDGSGLGLSIVAGIAGLLNGKVSVKSEKGKGSVFYIMLPVNGRKKQKHTGIIKDQAEMATKRIVSFEDNKASVEYLNIVMEMLGYEHINFDNALKGIEYLRNNRADLVLMDVQMPMMDGYEATRIIKREFPGLPVIIQTAYAMQSDKDKAFQAGCDDYLSKPLSLKTLKEKIISTVEKVNF